MKKPIYAWRFKSSSSDKVYETLLWSDNSLSCDCKGWTQRVIRCCKHTRSVQTGDANSEAESHGEITESKIAFDYMGQIAKTKTTIKELPKMSQYSPVKPAAKPVTHQPLKRKLNI